MLISANLPERKEATETHIGVSETEKDFLATPSISRTLYWQVPFRNTPPALVVLGTHPQTSE